MAETCESLASAEASSRRFGRYFVYFGCCFVTFVVHIVTACSDREAPMPLVEEVLKPALRAPTNDKQPTARHTLSTSLADRQTADWSECYLACRGGSVGCCRCGGLLDFHERTSFVWSFLCMLLVTLNACSVPLLLLVYYYRTTVHNPLPPVNRERGIRPRLWSSATFEISVSSSPCHSERCCS